MSIFDKQAIITPQSSTFDLSHDIKLSMNMGKLVPFFVEEVMPGDNWSIRTESLIRFMPLVTPVMHRFKVYQNFFFVPTRILSKNFDEWIFQNAGTEEVSLPTVELDTSVETTRPFVSIGTLADYMGLQPYIDSSDDYASEPVYVPEWGADPSLLPFAAYQKIYYEYFRDQNFIDEESNDPEYDYIRSKTYVPDGIHQITHPAVQGLLKLRTRAWKKDYFTSALPFPQKGDAVNIPMGFDNVGVFTAPDGTDTFTKTQLRVSLNGASPTTSNISTSTGQLLGNTVLSVDAANSGFMAKTSDLQPNDATINNLRTAFAVQRWLEKNAVGGTRYVEGLQKHFGVSPQDSRLQRPEYIGGSAAPVVISEVLSTALTQVEQDEEYITNPVGDMAGHAISTSGGKKHRYYAQEHGYIIGIVSVMPDALYWQGVRRMWFKKDQFDFAFPSFAHLGEQPVFNIELYASNPAASQYMNTFGYQSRYSEYKHGQNRVAGQFRHTLAFWHYGRLLKPGNDYPELNSDFIEFNNDKRIFAVTDEEEHEVIMHLNNITFVNRKLPKYGTPL